MRAVDVFGEREDRGLAWRTARNDRGNFFFKLDDRLEHALFARAFRPDFRRLIVRSDELLALAVVTKSSALENRGTADDGERTR